MRSLIALIILFTAFTADANAASDSLADLHAAVVQEDFKSANAMARDLLKQNLTGNQAVEALYYLGLSHLRLGEYLQSYDAFKRLLGNNLSPEWYDKADLGLIDSMYMRGQYENALREATALMVKHPGSEMMPLIYLKAARANLKLARWSKAREFLQKIAAEYPDTFEAATAQGLMEEKHYFAVQVGAFNDKARAEALMKELTDRNEYAYIVETKTPEGRKFFRVRAGQLSALKDAQALEKKLATFGYPTLIYP